MWWCYMPGMTFGSLFSGAGGMDLGLERAGMVCKWMVEKNKQCQAILKKNLPGGIIFDDITEKNKYLPVDLIAGGDPCPIRSRARSNGESKHPDLSGYFLAVVGRMRPRWVVRENVPAPDDIDFATGLAIMGYRTVIIRLDAAPFTGQRRIRDFIIGSYQASWPSFAKKLCQAASNTKYNSPSIKTKQIIPCLTANRSRYDSRDCYIFDGKLRILDSDERTAFAGFPDGWFDGLSGKNLSIYIIARENDLWEWVNQNVELMGVKDLFVTGNLPYVSCTIRDGKKEVLQINILDQKVNAEYVGNLLKLTGCVKNIDLQKEDTAILWLQKDINMKGQKIEPVINQLCIMDNNGKNIKPSWNLLSTDRLNRKKLSTILTWIKKMTHQPISIYAPPDRNTQKRIDLLKKLLNDYCNQEQSFLIVKMENMKSLSKSAIARMTGNAVVQQVAEWIGKAIMQANSLK